MLPTEWEPAACETVRVGSAHDGGYLVSPKAVAASDLLIGMGLNDDWAFEEGFRARNPVPVICFDHTVSLRLWARVFLRGILKLRPRDLVKYLSYRRFFRGQVQHRKACVGHDSNGVSLATVLAETSASAIFLKADIEGAEYRLLNTIAENAGRFTGVVMELHFVDLHRDRITAWLKAMSGHVVTALHANNFGGVDPGGDPLTVEITLTRRDLVGRQSTVAEYQPCDARRPDIALRFAQKIALAA